MPATYRFASVVLWALLCVCAAAAQTTSTAAPAPAELHISLGARQIKFTPLRQYQELRLEVFDHSGELRYASGAVTEAALDYDLRDSNGQPLAPGLYAYTLTVQVADAETPRQHQGHFIIEKGQDQIWLTSKDADSMGAAVTGGALTVSRSPERTTAGYLASGRTLGERAGLRRDLPGRTIVDEPVETPRRLTPNISGSGTTGRITKWNDGPNGVVGDSIIYETASGDIGVGTTTPGGVFDLLRNSSSDILQRFWNTGTGGSKLRYVSANGAVAQVQFTNLSEWLTAIANTDSSLQFRVRGVGTPNNETELNNSARLTILRNGNVGIGTITPNTRLELNAGVANTSGLRFTQLTSASPVGSETAYLAVDTLGNVVRGATPSGGSGGAPAGSTGQIQFNSSGALGADASLLWDNTNKRLGVGIDPPTARLHVSTASGHAVYGVSTLGYGVFGQSNGGGSGVFGANTNPVGGGFAGQFSGHVQVSNNLHVGGNLTKAMGSFKIDHPLDPANKYLYHSFVESPDMKNIYDGNVTTDNLGFAVVTLPDYFAALNRDFRYQLTVIGTFAQAIIAEKIKGNQFTIRTSLPNVEVSWLVTGIRRDAYAEAHRIRVEEDKPEQERGSYLHPELHGQPEEKSLEWARNPELMRQLKQQREKAEKEKKQN